MTAIQTTPSPRARSSVSGPIVRALLVCAALALPSAAPAQPVKGNYATAELLSETRTAQPGTPLALGIRIVPEHGWHTYWTNPGQTGLAARVKWSLPPGFSAGELQWPHPDRIGKPPYVGYGYKGDLTLLATVDVPSSAPRGENLAIAANVSWLVCREDACVPGKADLALDVPVSDAPPQPDATVAALFRAVRHRVPRALDQYRARLIDGADSIVLKLDGPAGDYPSTQDVEVFPVDFNVVDENVAAVARATDRGLEVVMRKRAGAKALPATVRAVVVARNGWDAAGKVPAIEVAAPVTAAASPSFDANVGGAAGGSGAMHDAASPAAPLGTAGTSAAARAASAPPDAADDVATRPAGAAPLHAADTPADRSASAPLRAADTSAAASAVPEAEKVTLLVALALAFAGGLILNLMPCVFPVLSLKILGFVHIAHATSAKVRRHGYVFAAGVIVSFWIMAGMLLLVRAGGEAMGWGFQLQEPGFVAVLALLLFAMALNLLGIFAIGSLVPSAAGRFDSHDGYRGSFFSGVLATVLATPCTAPFMGAALGFAMAQPPMIAMAVFTALGAGMAAPYVLLSCMPALLRRLPRPGEWMETFRQAMAFPLLATVLWLVWVFGQQVGNDGVLRLLSGFLLIGVAAWIGGRFGPAPLAALGRMFARGATATALVAGVALVASAASLPTAIECAAAGEDPSGVAWTPYDAGRLAELRAQGRPVFVDFTADWCLSCKVNERVALQSPAVQSRLRELDVVAMKGDWTRGDPEVTRALQSFGRNGVPLYVLYPRGEGSQPVLLPSILTPDIVLQALSGAA
ncbi:MAG TPA: thioredoxin family protein [Candidatus Binatia bacterium]|nr:thioredoxin family protein [Candidatus Binatia bacterium]